MGGCKECIHDDEEAEAPVALDAPADLAVEEEREAGADDVAPPKRARIRALDAIQEGTVCDVT